MGSPTDYPLDAGTRFIVAAAQLPLIHGQSPSIPLKLSLKRSKVKSHSGASYAAPGCAWLVSVTLVELG